MKCGENDDILINGAFLVILSVAGNFISETLGCSTQKLLETNMYAKNILTFIIIYFSIQFSNKKIEHPLCHIKESFIIWLLFVAFSRMNTSFTVIVFLLLTCMYYCHNAMNYHDSMKDTINYEKFKKFKKVFTQIAFVMLCIGFIVYSQKQFVNYKNDFSLLKYIFGVHQCTSLS